MPNIRLCTIGFFFWGGGGGGDLIFQKIGYKKKEKKPNMLGFQFVLMNLGVKMIIWKKYLSQKICYKLTIFNTWS
jgi:hypothetical protein